MKALCLGLFVVLYSYSALSSSECARSVSELRELVGSSDLALNWIEKDKKPLVLKLSDAKEAIALTIHQGENKWADITGVICKKGSNYQAKLETVK